MKKMDKILFVTALNIEAEPVKKYFNLKKVNNCKGFALFDGPEHALVISGIGKVRSGAATAFAIAALDVLPAVIINYGLAGAINYPDAEKGDLFLIDSVKDGATGREFYPDLLIKTDIEYSSIVTVDKMAISGTNIKFGDTKDDNLSDEQMLADMEASGFFETAQLFAGPHLIALFKVIADKGHCLNSSDLEQAKFSLDKRFPIVADYAASLLELSQSLNSSVLSENQLQLVDLTVKKLSLTVSQTHKLIDLSKGYVIKNSVLRFPDIQIEEPKTKKSRNRQFNKICDFLINGTGLAG